MSKLELTKTQLENIENKSILVLPIAENIDFIDEYDNYISMVIEKSATMNLEAVGDFSSIESALSYLLKYHCPVQKGDKDVWIAEEYTCDGEYDYIYKLDALNNVDIIDTDTYDWIDASAMTKEQSRYTISEILDVRVVRAQDIEHDEIFDIYPTIWDDNYCDNDQNTNCTISWFIEFYNQILKEHNIDRTYNDNDYVFLVEYKY